MSKFDIKVYLRHRDEPITVTLDVSLGVAREDAVKEAADLFAELVRKNPVTGSTEAEVRVELSSGTRMVLRVSDIQAVMIG
jgi:hypothetical protein